VKKDYLNFLQHQKNSEKAYAVERETITIPMNPALRSPTPNSKLAISPANGAIARAACSPDTSWIFLIYKVAAVAKIIKKANILVKNAPKYVSICETLIYLGEIFLSFI